MQQDMRLIWLHCMILGAHLRATDVCAGMKHLYCIGPEAPAVARFVCLVVKVDSGRAFTPCAQSLYNSDQSLKFAKRTTSFFPFAAVWDDTRVLYIAVSCARRIFRLLFCPARSTVSWSSDWGAVAVADWPRNRPTVCPVDLTFRLLHPFSD